MRRLWDAGLAHRDIKPANLLVRDHRVLLIDVGLRGGPPKSLAAGGRPGQYDAVPGAAVQPKRVYQRALRQFNTEEITEELAAPLERTPPAPPRLD